MSLLKFETHIANQNSALHGAHWSVIHLKHRLIGPSSWCLVKSLRRTQQSFDFEKLWRIWEVEELALVKLPSGDYNKNVLPCFNTVGVDRASVGVLLN